MMSPLFNMNIAGIQRTSTIDFPGMLACVLFTRGCDMDCFFCHNRALIGPGDTLPAEEVESFLQKRRGLLDGVVISGGEPTLQTGLPDFLLHLRELGYQVKLDTNGLRPDLVQQFVAGKLIAYAAIDWKAPASSLTAVCGADDPARERTRKTILFLLESGLPFEARTTLYPGLTAGELLALAGELPTLPCYRLNFFKMPEQFRPEDETRLQLHALGPGEIKAMEPELRNMQPNLIF